jgi:hypothetical protein
VTDVHPPPEIESRFDRGEEFLAGVVTNVSGGPATFRLPLPQGVSPVPDARPGALLSVILRFDDRGGEFHVHGRVLERRNSGPERGLLLEFLPEERERQELVLAWAAGESVPYYRRTFPRVPCRLPVRVEMGRTTLETVVDVIGRGGLHLQASAPLEPDATVTLAIEVPGRRKRLQVRGRVASVVARGPQEGAGIEFLFESAEQRDEVATEVARLTVKHSG